jgi:hypothetical protein
MTHRGTVLIQTSGTFTQESVRTSVPGTAVWPASAPSPPRGGADRVVSFMLFALGMTATTAPHTVSKPRWGITM